MVCRDRAPLYIDAATTGAPQAVQVADRWHLWHNLGEVAERCIAPACGPSRRTHPRRHLLLESIRRPSSRGRPDTASPTAPGPDMQPSTNCSPQVTVAGPSPGDCA
ncbi:hypothetical protein [Streptodolium elevatio]|uniref:hypothetical protein n=1 Tax=Streptodolium elevatio TaxID=3157996 RepID=UPI003F4CD89B